MFYMYMNKLLELMLVSLSFIAFVVYFNNGYNTSKQYACGKKDVWQRKARNLKQTDYKCNTFEIFSSFNKDVAKMYAVIFSERKFYCNFTLPIYSKSMN